MAVCGDTPARIWANASSQANVVKGVTWTEPVVGVGTIARNTRPEGSGAVSPVTTFVSVPPVTWITTGAESVPRLNAY